MGLCVGPPPKTQDLGAVGRSSSLPRLPVRGDAGEGCEGGESGAGCQVWGVEGEGKGKRRVLWVERTGRDRRWGTSPKL